MCHDPNSARFKLYYCPPFRSSFITHLFAFQGVPLQEERRFEVSEAMWHGHPKDQPIPLMGPPLLEDLQTGQILSQLPAVDLRPVVLRRANRGIDSRHARRRPERPCDLTLSHVLNPFVCPESAVPLSPPVTTTTRTASPDVRTSAQRWLGRDQDRDCRGL